MKPFGGQQMGRLRLLRVCLAGELRQIVSTEPNKTVPKHQTKTKTRTVIGPKLAIRVLIGVELIARRCLGESMFLIGPSAKIMLFATARTKRPIGILGGVNTGALASRTSDGACGGQDERFLLAWCRGVVVSWACVGLRGWLNCTKRAQVSRQRCSLEVARPRLAASSEWRPSCGCR